MFSCVCVLCFINPAFGCHNPINVVLPTNKNVEGLCMATPLQTFPVSGSEAIGQYVFRP